MSRLVVLEILAVSTDGCSSFRSGEYWDDNFCGFEGGEVFPDSVMHLTNPSSKFGASEDFLA